MYNQFKTDYKGYKKYISDKVFINMETYIKCSDPIIKRSDYIPKDIFGDDELETIYLRYMENVNISRSGNYSLWKEVADAMYEAFPTISRNIGNAPIDGVIITGNNFNLIKLCRKSFDYFNNSKQCKIDRIFFLDKFHKYNKEEVSNYISESDIPVDIIDAESPRKDGLIRQTSLNTYDESHFRNFSNMSYFGKTYLVIDSDVIFTNYFDINNLDGNGNFPYSWFQRIDDEVKYWIGSFVWSSKSKGDNNVRSFTNHIGAGLHFSKMLCGESNKDVTPYIKAFEQWGLPIE